MKPHLITQVINLKMMKSYNNRFAILFYVYILIYHIYYKILTLLDAFFNDFVVKLFLYNKRTQAIIYNNLYNNFVN